MTYHLIYFRLNCTVILWSIGTHLFRWFRSFSVTDTHALLMIMIQHECSASLTAIVSLLLLSFVFAPILSRTRPIRNWPIRKMRRPRTSDSTQCQAHTFSTTEIPHKLRVNGQYAACLALLRTVNCLSAALCVKCVRLHLANGILSCICKPHVWLAFDSAPSRLANCDKPR